MSIPILKTELYAVLVNELGYNHNDAVDEIEAARECVTNGADPEEVLYEHFSLEPDFVFDLF